eukprot:TRINITY_DN8179_c0_g1_i1.p1 TRINITY_DN8179_c0_g1~~TRINITY_DN8179_c0_g1_i1.p1  ORF type:complete len:679 (+),score=72.86 TRINITY_DN8179_c0_g1_i1:35-2038(+)
MAGPPGSLEERLEDLQRCVSKGLLTEEEHQVARKTTLASFTSFSFSSSSSVSPTYSAHAWTLPALESFKPEEGGRDDGEFWCNIIRERAMPTIAVAQRHDQMTMAELQVYDITAGRVRELFDSYDTNSDGFITCEELHAGLRSSGLPLKRDTVEKLMLQTIRRGHRSEAEEVTVNQVEFRAMLSRLRLAELFTPSAGCFQFQAYAGERFSCPTYICDYNKQTCTVQNIHLGGKENTAIAQQFFFGSRTLGSYVRKPSSQASRLASSQSLPRGLSCSSLQDGILDYTRDARWVHVNATDGLDRLTLMRLAVKYHLHPLAIDDIIDNRTPTKLDHFDEHFFISLDILALAGCRCTTSHDQSCQEPQRVRISRSNVSMFLSLPPQFDTLVSILQDRPHESSWMAMWRSSEEEEDVEPTYELWGALQRSLSQQPPPRMREKRTDCLLYEILDRAVDQLRPIAEAYAKRLGFMHQFTASRFPDAWLDEQDEVELELRDLARSIRPLRQVVRHLITEPAFSGSKMYFEDVEDNIDQMLEDIQQLLEMCKTLGEAHSTYRDKRMNATLYVLSIASVIFLPAQFVTGLYGMNFQNADGSPGIPELKWEHGYLYFWILQLILVLVAVFGAVLLHYSDTKWVRSLRSGCRYWCSAAVGIVMFSAWYVCLNRGDADDM